ncbi:hypothetical protein A3C91_04765 [Candidatus Azambacteria bacterium RIFCSPHIGHO2_02_FULL_52_12]|uniref:Uncharacterized protein n=1 Tax=Candidatus Azambacteria bacterium RIFCSPLOWO2_01_FULL_46_25 TaxID=1797298 RepID=A0A1F5BUY6_9BACT|nr:MAG: hypothetical protein A3C91_04765 [Candidatus Azambacteria bacterium RIFCSPHIGHO2_02_FULL_52_12]OGD34381.1 MAG: hypothetical protein A2988_02535 [Candidatus Azambacteria bacterium RIFCSPLOWO2_01_FULL_46_25]OGD37341.1 MAG: hypothetical protein A2850_01350 [Candidatus Azambacteria bacterium RIFCSPHIGHO2_01_FULL_51_74]
MNKFYLATIRIISVPILVASLVFVGIPFGPKNMSPLSVNDAQAATSIKEGTFVKNTATGNQAVTGVGFQPKAIIFFWTRQAVAGFSAFRSNGVGFATGVANQRAVAVAENDNAATSNSGRYRSEANTILMLSSGTPVLGARAAFVSFDADGFTVNWAVNEARSDIIHYLAIGGADITNATASTFTLATGTGNQAVNTVGFQPSFVMFLWGFTEALDTASAGLEMGMGFAQGPTQQASIMNVSRDGRASNDFKYSQQRTDNSILLTNLAGAQDALASFVSMDASGFTVNKSNAPAANTPVFFLALRGGQYNVGSFNQPVATGAQTVSAPGFQPIGLMFSSFNRAASTTLAQEAEVSLGSATASTARSNIWAESRTIDPSDTNTYENTTSVLTLATGPGTIDAQADFSAFTATGFTLNWTTVDATARQIIYVAIGHTPVPNWAQNYFRFYVANDALTPTDPWPAGAVDTGENAEITIVDMPPASGEIVRIRMSLRVSIANASASAQDFKLQFGQRSTTCSAIGAWTDFGAPGSAAIWRGFNATPVDGAALSGDPPIVGDLKLSVSDRAGTYEEANNTALNPFAIAAGEDVEYDWVVQDNGAVAQAPYCFRMVKSAGTLLDSYVFYPVITASGYRPQSQNWRWYDDEINETPTIALAAENIAPINIIDQNILKLRVTIKDTAGVAGPNVKMKLQFSEYSDFSSSVADVVEQGSCTGGSLWCYADGGGVDNALITTATLSDAGACSGGAGIGCGTHNESGTSASALAPQASAAVEFEFTIRHAGARANTVYFFRPFFVGNGIPAPFGAGKAYPSVSTEGAALTFTVSGLPSGTATEGITTNVATTPASVAFGTLSFGTIIQGAQRLSVSTNATEGYQIFLAQSQGLLSPAPSEILPVSSTNAAPASWASACPSSAVGCYGYHPGDDVLAAGSLRFTPNDTYAQLETTPREIAYSQYPVTAEANDVVFRIQITNQQEPGSYQSAIGYIAVPTF